MEVEHNLHIQDMSSAFLNTVNGEGYDNDTTCQYIPLCYDPANSDTSARALIFTLYPEWETSPGEVEFVRFKEGITNNAGTSITKTCIHADQPI